MRQRNGLVRIALVLAIILLLPRLIPVLVRLGPAVVSGLRGFWWVILPAVIVTWLIARAKRPPPVRMRRPLHVVTAEVSPDDA